MHLFGFVLSFVLLMIGSAAQAQSVIELSDKGGLHAAYVVPTDNFHRVDVQLIVLSGEFDDPDPSGTAHLTEHLAAFSADATILRKPRERDIHAAIYPVSTVYTNSGPPSEIENLLRLSRAVLDTPKLSDGFAESEIDILQRETLLYERQFPRRWLKRIALHNLYGTLRGRADNTIADLPKLSIEKAYQFHKEHYVASNVTLIVSGRILPDKAGELVARIFGDTEPSAVPEKPWLDQKPDPALRSVEYIESDRLIRDTVQFVKFVDFKDRPTSIDMQGAFFITTEILNSRLRNALYFEDERFIEGITDWHFLKNADLQLSIDMQLMPGVDLEAAHLRLIEIMDTLLIEPISQEEIDEARRRDVAAAQTANRDPAHFLWFLKNVAGDGFPPVSPTVFAEMLNNTSDQDVLEFAAMVLKPSATSIVLAKKVD